MARSGRRSGGGGGPAGRSWRRWPREGEGAEGRGARRCPGLICRYCGSGGGGRVGRGLAAERDRVTPSRSGGWAGGIGGERRGAGTPSPVEAGPPPPRGPGRPWESCREARSGAAWGPSSETSSCAPPAPGLAAAPGLPAVLPPPASAASPFRRKAPLSAAGRVESAWGSGGSANGAGQRFLRSGRPAAGALCAGPPSRRRRRGRGARPAGRRGGVNPQTSGARGAPSGARGPAPREGARGGSSAPCGGRAWGRRAAGTAATR